MIAARYIYFTSNVSDMVTFYQDVMGMSVLNSREAISNDPDGWVQLRSGDMEVGIHRASKPGCKDRNRNKLVFIVDSVAKSREGLAALGVRMGKHQIMSQYESCDFKDPDGNVLQLSSR
jgi:catechol 2,3-dioxygenase-like lactoylglutathione lyase family enzyme